MIHAGACSLTLGHLSPAEVIDLCSEAGLTHIEWWGRERGHVPMGEVETARTVGEMTHEAGLTISTYGSYYRVGESEDQGLTFDTVLETALAMRAPAVRVWAGTQGSDSCDDKQRARIVADTLRIADLCAASKVELIFEYHGNTLTDSNVSARAFAADVEHPAVFFSWQCRTGVSGGEKLDGLREMLQRLGTLHVFNWAKNEDGRYVRHPLAGAVEEWRGYFDLVAETGRDHVALLEFVKGNAVEQFKDDARVLRELLCQGRRKSSFANKPVI
jgi:3-dehydroshikimate dehydratase